MNLDELAKACATFILQYSLDPENLEKVDESVKAIFEIMSKHFGVLPREEVLPTLGISISENVTTKDKFG